jgi:SAM-dependent methyltransferase
MATAGPKRWLFDGWSLFYDLPWVQRAVYRGPHDAVVEHLRNGACRRVLDVGCGTGILATRLRGELPGTQVVGCDFSSGMLRHAQARDRHGSWVRGDGGRLPFRSGSFDAIVSTEAFHWFPDKRAALTEFRRVLRRRGRLLLVLVNPYLAVTGRGLALVARAVGEPFYWPTRTEMRRMVEAAGFRVDRQVPLFRLPGLLFPPVLTLATDRGEPCSTRMPSDSPPSTSASSSSRTRTRTCTSVPSPSSTPRHSSGRTAAATSTSSAG